MADTTAVTAEHLGVVDYVGEGEEYVNVNVIEGAEEPQDTGETQSEDQQLDVSNLVKQESHENEENTTDLQETSDNTEEPNDNTEEPNDNTEEEPNDTAEEDTQEEAPNLVFKCVPVSSDGKPDTAKTLKLNADILKEVLAKHGFSMDPNEWPEYALEADDGEKEKMERKQKKKAKKLKRKKEREDKVKDIKEQMQCKYCKQQFFDVGHLKIHEKVHLDENQEPLECTLCSLVFKREIGLKYHMLKVHNKAEKSEEDEKEEEEEGTFHCEEDECDKSFKSSRGLKLHTNQIHFGIGKIKSLKAFKDEIGGLQCDKCDKTFSKPSKLSMHMNTHSDLNLKCAECSTVFKNHNLRRRHMQQVHQDVKPCPQCGKRFRKPKIVIQNMDPEIVPDALKAEAEEICYKCFYARTCKVKKTAEGEGGEDDETKNGKDFLKCPICTLIYYGHRGLSNHMKRTHPDKYQDIEEKCEDMDAMWDFRCEEEGCNRSFTTRRGLGLHMVSTHIKDAKYSCTEEGCDRAFITRSGLSSHLKRHEAPAAFACDQCAKTYEFKYKLTEHMKSHSKGDLECDQCDKTFKRQGLLCQHVREHTGVAFTCPDCGKQFKRAEYVRRHQLSVHDSDPTRATRKLKRKICEVCNHGCSTNAELRDHMNSHTGAKPHLCEFCPKTFACKASLFVHRQAHKEAYRCKWCNKVFGDRTRMKEHQVVHTGEKPFICQLCGRKFGHRSNLREHLRRIHKNKEDGDKPVTKRFKTTSYASPSPQKETIFQLEEGPHGEAQHIQYEIIDSGHAAQVAGEVIPIQIHPSALGTNQATTIQVFQQQAGSGEIELQEIKDGETTFVRTIQIQDGRIELQNPEQALAAEIVLQLHSDQAFT